MGLRRRTDVILPFVLVGILSTAGAACAQPDDVSWQYVDRVMLELGENATYVVTVWTDAHDPDAIALDPQPRFQLVLSRPGNLTLREGPPLRLEAWHCPDRTCPDERPPDNGFLALLADGDDEAVDGHYEWTPDRERLGMPGSWRFLVTADGAPLGTGATLDLRFVARDPAGASWIEHFAALRDALDSPIGRVLLFFIWLVLFAGVARIGAATLRRTVFSPQRIDPTIGRLAIRLGSVIFLLLGLAFSLWVVWGLNFWAGLTALGLLSVALGFGMQNTVANLMGGINLAIDRPFVLGDRVQVGDTWGDVQEIGLRSTRILTTKHEVVIIPNKLLDEREIWNYTIQHPELRIDVDVGVSYDSDRRLAEALMLRAAAAHQDVLPYPKPRVLLQGFGESAVELQLRAWIPGAKDARPIASRIRKDIQDLFNAHGVTIPFPHRTLVRLDELKPPHKATPEELDALAVRDPRLPKMVYATAGPEPLRATADLVAHTAAELDLALVVLHVTTSLDPRHRKQAARVMDAFHDAGAHHGVAVETIERFGDVTEAIKNAVEDHAADLLAIGSSRQSLVSSPRHLADLTRRIREAVDVPVLIVPRNLRLNDRALKHYGKLIAERQKQKRGDKGIEPRDEGDEPDGPPLEPGENGEGDEEEET